MSIRLTAFDEETSRITVKIKHVSSTKIYILPVRRNLIILARDSNRYWVSNIFQSILWDIHFIPFKIGFRRFERISYARVFFRIFVCFGVGLSHFKHLFMRQSQLMRGHDFKAPKEEACIYNVLKIREIVRKVQKYHAST